MDHSRDTLSVMYFKQLYLAIGILPYFFATVIAADCANVTIHNASEAKEVAKNCKVLTGELIIDSDLNETISLDGVETIQGDISHNGCYRVSDDGCFPVPKPFKISSSTLTHINGSLYFWAFNGLEEISFPNLQRVEKSFTIKRMHSLKQMDLTKLSHLGNLLIEARNLTKIDHNGLRNFTGGSPNAGIEFWSAVVESVDSWYKYPIEVKANYTDLPKKDWPPTVDINGHNLPNVKNVSINWSKINEIRVLGDSINIVLGGENTTIMELKKLTLTGNNTSIERGSELEKFVVGNVTVEKFSDSGEIDLSPLDSISVLELYRSDGLSGSRLSPNATSWKDFSLHVDNCASLNLTSEYRDAENEKDRFWYWPEGDIRSINIRGTPIGNEFFKTFLEKRAANDSESATVTERFYLQPRPWGSDLDCAPFDELKNASKLSKDYFCQSLDSESLASINCISLGSVIVAALGAAFLSLL